MADNSPPTQEDQDEIAAFITEGMHRVATISTSDYGFLLSSRLAQSYLQRAILMLDTKRSSSQAMRRESSTLKTVAGDLAVEYAKFETFCIDCDRFKQRETKGVVEWCSKCAVRVISSGRLGMVNHHLAYKIRSLHARVCSVLTER